MAASPVLPHLVRAKHGDGLDRDQQATRQHR
jgi:hypothetical protein